MAAKKARRASAFSVALTAILMMAAPLSAAGAQDLGGFNTDVDQDLPVALVADEVSFDSETGIVIARGSVEVFHGDRTLTADMITYDSRNDIFSAEGQIALRDQAGVVVFADMAELDAELRDGLVKGARAVMSDGSRMSAVSARRIDGEVNALSKVVFSACEVCAADPEPLWQIRARRVVHDQVQKEIFYEDAVLEVEGVPVFWFPYFSHPDPTVKRRSGFLTPKFQSSTTYGYGMKIPYHFVLGPDRDMTLTAFGTTTDGLIMEGEYRAVTETGDYAFEGSATVQDYDGEERFRGHVFGNALFTLQNRFEYGADVALSTDDAYLRRYDFTDDDRLTNELFLRRYQNDSFASLSGLYFQSNREDEPQEEVPVVLPELELRQRFDAPYIGGDFFANGGMLALAREEGRDVIRFSAGLDWERSLISDTGFAFRGFAETRADYYSFDDDPTTDDTNVARALGLGGVEVRYPFVKHGDRNTQIFEPIAQFILSHEGGNPDEVPNEDSLEISFDETNLFSTSRSPGRDLWEEGSRINLGWRYELLSEGGLDLNASGGRVLRFEEAEEFPDGSGLSGTNSDYVAAWGIGFGENFEFINRFRLTDDFRFARNEILAELDYDRWRADASYVFFESDEDADIFIDREEVAFTGEVDLDPSWTLSAGFRYDAEADEFLRARGGLVYTNECIEVDLSVGRRFTDSEGAPAATSVGLEIRLLSIAMSREERAASRACGN